MFNANSKKLYSFGMATIFMTLIYGFLGLVAVIKCVNFINDMASRLSSFGGESISSNAVMINMFLVFSLMFSIVMGLTAGYAALGTADTHNDKSKGLKDAMKSYKNKLNVSNETNEIDNQDDDLEI